jgi:hypothetical protein
VALADGANLLVHEAVFVPTPEMVEELALEADPELLRREAALHTTLDAVPVFALQITSVVDDTYDGRIAVAGDGDEFTP